MHSHQPVFCIFLCLPAVLRATPALDLEANSIEVSRAVSSGSLEPSDELRITARAIRSSLNEMNAVTCMKSIRTRRVNDSSNKNSPEIRIPIRYSRGIESWDSLSVDGREMPAERARLRNWVYGEMGPILDDVADAIDAHQFSLTRRQKWGGQAVDVFSRNAIGSWQLTLGDLFLPAYRQEIWVWSGTGQIARVSNVTTGPFGKAGVNVVTWMIDYDMILLATRRYLVPIHSFMTVDYSRSTLQMESAFLTYREFTSEASIRFEKTAENPR